MKKLKIFYQINILIIFILIPLSSAFSEDSINEKKLNNILKQLRCMTCQNQTIYESDSDFSKQMKNEIMNQIEEKKTEKQIIDFMVDRYGEYILLKPKYDIKNLFLWIAPFILLIGSLLVLFSKIRKN